MERVEITVSTNNKIVLYRFSSKDIITGDYCVWEGVEHYLKALKLAATLAGVSDYNFWVVITCPFPLQYTTEELQEAILQCTEDKEDVLQIFYASIALYKPQISVTKRQYIQNLKDGIKIFEEAGFINTSAMFEDWKTMSYTPLLMNNEGCKRVLQGDRIAQICKNAQKQGNWDPSIPSTYIDTWDQFFVKE